MNDTRKDDIIENFYGTKVADPYRWLEDPESADTTAWVQKRNEEQTHYFSESKTSEKDRARLEELWDYPKIGVPRKIKNRLFYMKNDGLQNQSVLYVKGDEKYPSVLLATAEGDDRVVPAHAKKFTATLLAEADPASKVLLRLEEKSGHGLGKPTVKVIEEWVDYFTFLDKELG